MNPPAFKIHLNDGSNYITSMAANVNLAMARRYFLGMKQTREDDYGREYTLRVVAVSQVQAVPPSDTRRLFGSIHR